MSKRGVAQPGSAPVLGTGGRRFESCRPDFIFLSLKPLAKHKRGVAQPGSAPVWEQVVAGSNPVAPTQES